MSARRTPDTPTIRLDDPADAAPPPRPAAGKAAPAAKVTKAGTATKSTPARKSTPATATPPPSSAAAAPGPAAAAVSAQPGRRRRSASDNDLARGELPHLEGEESPGEQRAQRTVNLPVSLIRRAMGYVAYAQWHGDPDDIESMADLFRIAVHRTISDGEEKYNGGRPFDVPARGLPRGPGPAGMRRTHNAARRREGQE